MIYLVRVPQRVSEIYKYQIPKSHNSYRTPSSDAAKRAQRHFQGRHLKIFFYYLLPLHLNLNFGPNLNIPFSIFADTMYPAIGTTRR